MSQNKPPYNFRIGYGVDIHRLVEGRPLILGGVHIESPVGALGHSDADVLLHAICDALLGAAALGDIGIHFPDTNPKYKDIDSKILLKEVFLKVRNKGYLLGNLDCTILLESPKISPYINEIKQTIAEILQTEVEQISVKATTGEKMGYVGEGKGIQAYCVALIYKC